MVILVCVLTALFVKHDWLQDLVNEMQQPS